MKNPYEWPKSESELPQKKMNRRVFLGGTLATVVGAIAVSMFPRFVDTIAPPPLTHEQKEAIIAEVMKTKEGRMALAKAMVEPKRTGLEYR